MKCTERETRYEHATAILVVKEAEEPKRTQVEIYKRDRGVSGDTSHWKGTVEQLRDLQEGIRLLFEEHDTLAPIAPTLNAASGGSSSHGVEGPRQAPDMLVLQVSMVDHRRMTDLANSIIQDAHTDQVKLQLAKLVNKVLGGTSASDGDSARFIGERNYPSSEGEG